MSKSIAKMTLSVLVLLNTALCTPAWAAPKYKYLVRFFSETRAQAIVQVINQTDDTSMFSICNVGKDARLLVSTCENLGKTWLPGSTNILDAFNDSFAINLEYLNSKQNDDRLEDSISMGVVSFALWYALFTTADFLFASEMQRLSQVIPRGLVMAMPMAAAATAAVATGALAYYANQRAEDRGALKSIESVIYSQTEVRRTDVPKYADRIFKMVSSALQMTLDQLELSTDGNGNSVVVIRQDI
jgi:hypothetical protein